MTTSPATAGDRSALIRRCALSVLAIGVGSIAVWFTTEYMRVFVDQGVDPWGLDVRALALMFLPAVTGLGLWIAAVLIVTRRRGALGVYWSAVLVAVAFELLTRFGGLDLSMAPQGEPQVVYLLPDQFECVMPRAFEVSLFGLLIVAGFWLSTPRPSEVEGVAAESGG